MKWVTLPARNMDGREVLWSRPGSGQCFKASKETPFPGRSRSEPSMDATAKWLIATARHEIARTIDSLPVDLQSHARSLPVVLDPRPGPDWIKDGWPPDLLGLFSGSPLGSGGDVIAEVPPSILIFYENLWEYSEGIEAAYIEEVHVTYLHELGHYLGLEESDLENRGLL